MPQVSIITPVHNAQDTIRDTVASVQAQSFGDYEHLLVDNNSTDESAAIIESLAAEDPRIRLLFFADQQGAAQARNFAITRAQGRFHAFLDADDQWLPEKLSTQIREMQERDLVLSWTGYRVVDAQGQAIREQPVARHATYRDILMKRMVIGCLTAVYDTERLGVHLMNPFPIGHDLLLWLTLIEKADREGLKYGGIDEVLALYRTGGMSAGKGKAAKMQWRLLREELGLNPVGAALPFLSYAWHGVADRLA